MLAPKATLLSEASTCEGAVEYFDWEKFCCNNKACVIEMLMLCQLNQVKFVTQHGWRLIS